MKPDIFLEMLCSDRMTTVAPDVNGRGLQVRLYAGDYSSGVTLCVLDVPLEPEQMRMVAAWLNVMAEEREEAE
ncbi:MAG: hypothetical protein E6451_10810 [Enterococcus faecalis]|nr:hypothetical protein [Enterococcus faecalis]